MIVKSPRDQLPQPLIASSGCTGSCSCISLRFLTWRARTHRAAPRSLGAVWVEAGGVSARQRRLRASGEGAASPNRRDHLAERLGGEVRLIARDRMTRLVGADENRRGR